MTTVIDKIEALNAAIKILEESMDSCRDILEPEDPSKEIDWDNKDEVRFHEGTVKKLKQLQYVVLALQHKRTWYTV